MPNLSFVAQKFTLTLGKVHISLPYIQAAAILLLIFALVFVLAQFRRHMVNWSLKGAVFGIFIGFFLALILEGFLIVGGKTALTGVLGWKNPPKPLAIALDLGREKLVQVLGINTQIPSSFAKTTTAAKTSLQTALTASEVIKFFQSLNPAEVKKAKQIICQ